MPKRPKQMKDVIKKIAVKSVKLITIAFAGILLLLFLVPIAFPGTIEKKIKTEANKNIEGEINFSRVYFSIFNHFPSLTITLHDVSLKGSAPYENDTLFASKEVAFGINLKQLLWNGEVKIDKVFISEALVDIKINEKGQSNYALYISEKPVDTTSSTSIKLEEINILHTRIKYNDLATKICIEAKDFSYSGKGDLSESVFDLYTKTKIDSLDFYFHDTLYLKNKKIEADLITNINTHSLSFLFKRDDLKINNLPIMFKGRFDLLKEGYHIDVLAHSEDCKLEDLFGALPPAYTTWLEQTKISGTAGLFFSLKGDYIVLKKNKPDLVFNMSIHNGSIQYKSVPVGISNLCLDLKTKMPALDEHNLVITMNTLSFNLGTDGYLNARVVTKGVSESSIKAKINAKLDLEALNKAFGVSNIDIKGLLDADVTIEGEYSIEKKIFPVTKARIALQKGWIKTPYYPYPVTDINIVANVIDKSGKYKDLKIMITPASFSFEGNPFYLNAAISNLDDVNYDIKAKGDLNVAKIYKVFSQKGLDFTGIIDANVSLKGKQSDVVAKRYDQLQNKGTLELRHIKTISDYFPKPFIIEEGIFSFDQDKMWFKKFRVTYQDSDFVMNGYLENVLDFVFSKEGILKGTFSVNSKYININEFMAVQAVKTLGKKAKSKGVVLIPPNLDLQLAAHVDKVNYNGLVLQNFKGQLTIDRGVINLTETDFDLIGCHVLMDANYEDNGPMKADFDICLQANNFDVQRAYKEIPLFREMVTAAEKAEGIISIDYHLKGILDQNMKPVYASLEGEGMVSVSKVKINGLKIFNVISQRTGYDGIDNPDVSKVDIKTSIKNDVIKIERFKMKVSSFRTRIEGETNLNGQLSLKMRLGLPPFGIIGIPVVIKGTHDDPDIKIFSRTREELDKAEFSDYKNL